MTRTFDKSRFGAQEERKPQAAVNPLRTFLVDPYNIAWQSMGTRQPGRHHLNFYTLREMARACQPVAAVIVTRQNQVARFAKRPHYSGDVGIQVRMRESKRQPTAAESKRIAELEEAILRCGVKPNPDGPPRPGLDPFVRALVRDSLTMDAIAIEMRDDKRGRLFDWWGVDAATIRLAAPGYKPNRASTQTYARTAWGVVGEGYGGVPQPNGAEIAYVQTIADQAVAEFTHDELGYWIRNPRTDLEANGYGYAELEQLIETVTGFLNGMTYNSRYFTHGNIPEGVLGLLGNFTQEQIGDFVRHWNGMVSGVGNSHRIPVLNSKDGKGVTWTAMKGSNKDMEFHAWLDFLVTMVCAIFQCDREEIGFDSKEAGGTGGGLSQGDQNATIQHSQSKGLLPLLQRIANGFNEDIMPRLDDSETFEFAWTGMDPDQEDQKITRAGQFVTNGIKTLNEVRAEFDLKKIPEDQYWGDVPANMTLFQAWQMGKQAELQAQGLMPQDDGSGQPGGGQQPPDQGGGQPPPPGATAPPNAPMTLPKINEDGSEEEGS